MEVAIALVLSVLVNFWQFSTNGELRAENEQLTEIAKACTTDREDERRAGIRAADARAAAEREGHRELANQQRDVRDSIKVAGADDCLASVSPLGSELMDREKQSTDRLNRIWLRGAGRADD